MSRPSNTTRPGGERRGAASCTGRASTCRSRSRRPGRASRRGAPRGRRRRPPAPRPAPRAEAGPSSPWNCLTTPVDVESRTSLAGARLDAAGLARLVRPASRPTRCSPPHGAAAAASSRTAALEGLAAARVERAAGRAARSGSAAARDRREPLAACRPRTGSEPAGPRVYGWCGPQNSVAPAAVSIARPGVHHQHVVGHLRDDAEVVGDQHDRRAELPLHPAAAARRSAPARSRRARWSARRRSAAAGSARRPSRSSPAGASRRRTGAGSRRRGAPGCGIPTRPSSSIARARACAPRRPARAAGSSRRSASRPGTADAGSTADPGRPSRSARRGPRAARRATSPAGPAPRTAPRQRPARPASAPRSSSARRSCPIRTRRRCRASGPGRAGTRRRAPPAPRRRAVLNETARSRTSSSGSASPRPSPLTGISETFVRSQLSVKKKNVQPCSRDEWNSGPLLDVDRDVGDVLGQERVRLRPELRRLRRWSSPSAPW